jgi:hypothetical protein
VELDGDAGVRSEAEIVIEDAERQFGGGHVILGGHSVPGNILVGVHLHGPSSKD